MALPKLNETPMFEMTVPSTGQKVRYRPYLVKEEKVMMMAFESGDTKSALQSIVDTISSCIEEGAGIDANKLSIFDIEYMFIKLRAKSVGEISNILATCSNSECRHSNPIEIDLDTLEVNVPKGNRIIEMNDNVQVEMRYPSYKDVANVEFDKVQEEPEIALGMIARSIEAILYNDERISAKDESPKDLVNFIESMTSSQFERVSKFFEDMPRLEKEITFNCLKCEKENTLLLRGLENFF